MIVKNGTNVIYTRLYDTATGQVLQTGKTLTVKVSGDGGADFTPAAAAVEIGTTGRYKITLSAVESNYQSLSILVTAASCIPVVLEHYPADSEFSYRVNPHRAVTSL